MQNSDNIEKAREIYPIGHIKQMGNRKYIKTATGWKYYGKGTGDIAQSHKQQIKPQQTQLAPQTSRVAKALGMTGYPVIDRVLEESRPVIDRLVADMKAHREREIQHAQQNNKPIPSQWNDRDEEMVRESSYVKIIASMANYIHPTDQIGEVRFHTEHGRLHGTGTIIRDGKSYNFSTQTIYAGGYNIQVFHIKYRMNTNLPAVSSSLRTNAHERIVKSRKLKDKIVELSNELRGAQRRLAQHDYAVEQFEASNWTDDQIAEMTQEQINSVITQGTAGRQNAHILGSNWYLLRKQRGNDANVWGQDQTQEGFNMELERERARWISDVRHRMKINKQYRREYRVTVSKIEAKIAEAQEQLSKIEKR